MANAWQTGAKFWSDDKRERVRQRSQEPTGRAGDLNLQKSDADAATWLPPRRPRCTYVAMQVLTKDRYGLWLTARRRPRSPGSFRTADPRGSQCAERRELRIDVRVAARAQVDSSPWQIRTP